MPSSSARITEVAVAVITRPDGSFLLGQRPPGSIYAGYWEFPGGKIEADEAPVVALTRELEEELGIQVLCAYPWITREFVYPHAHVRLHFFRVSDWRGEICDHIHSALTWGNAAHMSVEPMLPANAPVLKALALPDFYAITDTRLFGVASQLERVETALQRGLRMLQIRENSMDPPVFADFAGRTIALGHRYGARVLINAQIDIAKHVGADGVHLRAAQLTALQDRPDLPLVGASVHDADEMERAARLELDFVVLGPVKTTSTHPAQAAMGWDKFAKLSADFPLPVFALGGLGFEDREVARRHGAHGIAAIRAAWG